ncbi:MAG: TonB-dependent receptor, partial [Polyangiales bacterium]
PAAPSEPPPEQAAPVPAPEPAAPAEPTGPSAPPPSAEAAAETLNAAEGDQPRALGAVVITARYRAEDAQRVPIAITTLGQEQLNVLGGTRQLNQLLGQLPSLNIQGYSGRNQTITIRGLGTNAGGTNDGLEQGVGLYIDGVYRPRTGSVITDLMDIESIQLLRGPQGTLFGKNTVAGAVDIHTIEPSFTRSVKAEFTYGNYNYARAYVSLNNPFTDRLALKVSYLRTYRDGLLFNSTHNEDWDDLNNDAVRADLLWKPTDHFKTRLIADYSMQRCDCGFQLIGRVLPTRLADGRQVRGFRERAAAIGYEPPPIDPFQRRTDIDASQSDRMPSYGLQNRADYRFDNDVSLTSITAYRRWKWLPHFDSDHLGADIAPLGIVETHQQQFSQELRLASPGEQLIDYTLGLYYFWQEADDHQYTSYGSQASGWNLPAGTPAEVLDELTAYSHVIPATHSLAAFGQATYNVTDSFHLTAGLRFTFEHKTGSYDGYPIGDFAPIDSLPEEAREAAVTTRASYAPTGTYDKSINVHNLSWTGIAAYDITRDIHAFATYSRGYKSPGINLEAPAIGVDTFVRPETVDDFELGAKASLFDGRFELNPTLFYMIDRNYQANYVDSARMPPARYITNVGTVVSRGVELDTRLFPLRGLMGSASFTYNDARYDSYQNAPAQFLTSYEISQDLSGQRASGQPRWSAGAVVEYSVPVGESQSSPIDVYFGGNWSFRSAFYAAVNLDPFSRVPRYHLLGLNFGIRNAKHWDVSFWVRNLLDTDYITTASVSANYGVTRVTVGEPRLFGVTVRGEL